MTAVPLEAPARYREHASARLAAPVTDLAVVGPAPDDVAAPTVELPARGGLRMLPPRREVHADLAEWEWQTEAACRRADPDLFFHPWGERDPSRGRRDAAAKAICAACPVQAPCRDVALATYEPYGVWGGLTEAEREQILGVRFG